MATLRPLPTALTVAELLDSLPWAGPAPTWFAHTGYLRRTNSNRVAKITLQLTKEPEGTQVARAMVVTLINTNPTPQVTQPIDQLVFEFKDYLGCSCSISFTPNDAWWDGDGEFLQQASQLTHAIERYVAVFR